MASRERSYASCPHCGVSVWDDVPKCPKCNRYIDRCSRCRSPIYPGKEECPRCKTFLVKEPRIVAKAVVLGRGLAGEKHSLKMDLKNTGNFQTEPTITVKMPEGISPESYTETLKDLQPGKSTSSTCEFFVGKPGNYFIENIEIKYNTSTGEIKTINIKAPGFNTAGRPELDVIVDSMEKTVKLGDFGEFIVKVKNVGTAVAKDINFTLTHPNTLRPLEKDIQLPKLEVDEERATIIGIKPLFDGKHAYQLKVEYHSIQTSAQPSMKYETPPLELNLNASVD